MAALDHLVWDDRVLRELPVDPEQTNRTRQVFGACVSRVDPTPVGAPTVLAWSPEVADLLGLTADDVASPRFAQAMGGNAVLPGMAPYANCYGGHQFGNWAGQLGDGRAITLGEVVTPTGHLELQLKGAGPTPYSRRGDGRAVLRSSIREFLCSEAMHHLGVPTTRALSLVGTGDRVLRDMFYDGNAAYEQGAVVCRVAPSFLRFGSFELFPKRRNVEDLRTLVQHTLRHHFPAIAQAHGEDSAAAVCAMLAEVCRRTATLVAHWMRVGFVHGVLNTDNLSILGLTIDYGPYGWLEPYDLDWTPNTTDAGMGRYRFGWQPNVAGWNLARLAEALFPLVGEPEPVQEALATYESAWAAAQQDMVVRKLGLRAFDAATDAALWDDLSAALELHETDMTVFFRALSGVSADVAAAEAASDHAVLQPVWQAYYGEPSLLHQAAMARWMRRYVARVAADRRDPAERAAAMDRANPKYVLRNYLAQEAIDLAEAGDLSRVHTLLEVMRRPYDEQPEHEVYASKRPEWARHKPGSSQLSCSS